jgi:hypothetical protein
VLMESRCVWAQNIRHVLPQQPYSYMR